MKIIGPVTVDAPQVVETDDDVLCPWAYPLVSTIFRATMLTSDFIGLSFIDYLSPDYLPSPELAKAARLPRSTVRVLVIQCPFLPA